MTMTKAKAWNGKDLKGTWEFTLKIDGVRAFAREDGWVSRNGKPLYNIPHPACLPYLVQHETFEQGFEVYCYAPGRSSKENYKATIERVRAKNKLRPIGTMDLYPLSPLDPRLHDCVITNPTAHDIKTRMVRAIDTGHEGLVLRQGDKWLKVKPVETHDVNVTAIIEGTGKHKGRMGALMTDMGKVGTGFTDEERTWWWDKRVELMSYDKEPLIEVECMQLNTYADGHEHCFGCGHHTPPDPEHRTAASSKSKVSKGLLKPDQWSAIPSRRLTVATLRRFGYFQAGHGGRMVQVAPLYDQRGNNTTQELILGPAEFEIIGEGASSPETLQLFGMHVFGDRNDRRVVLHTDKRDCMSTAQATTFRIPCACLNGGDTGAAMNSCKSNYRWLDRFQEIVLFFPASKDSLAQEIAALFPVGKVKVARIPDCEGPSEALVANRDGDISNAVWSALPWRPIGIVNAMDGFERFIEEGLQVPSWPYPWREYNDRTMGIRPAEVTYHVGGTGIAKTTLMAHYATHLIKWDGKRFLKDHPDYPRQPPCKVGWLGFEDSLKSVKVILMGIHEGRMLHLEATSKDETRRIYTDLFGEGRLELYDPEQAEYGLQAVLSYIRYMARALDCKIIFIDPLTFIVSMLPAANRTQAEDSLAAELSAMAKAFGVAFHIGYHLKKPDGTPFEEGAQIGLPDIKGSGALSHFAHNVMAYERNQQGKRPDLLRVRQLKNRVARYTGELCILKYDMMTGRYSPTKEKWPDEDGNDGGGGRLQAP